MLRPVAWAGLAFLLYGAGLAALPLVDPDEGRYAEIAREMLASGDFITPHLNGVVYLEKPPLYDWLVAAAVSILGPGEIGYRICSVMFGLGGLGLAYLLGRSMGGSRSAFLAAVILGTSPLYTLLARVNIIDMTLSFFLTACLTCYWLAQARPPGKVGHRLYMAAFAAAALAVLCKGLIGIVLPGGIVIAHLIATRRLDTLKRIPWWTGGFLFVAIAVPWHVLAALRNPGFLEFYLIREHLLRFATPVARREGPIWFFLPVLLGGMLPWIGLLSGALAGLWQRRRAAPAAGMPERSQPPRLRHDQLFLLIWAGLVFLFFSLSHSKLVPYVLPACAPIAVSCALVLERALAGRRLALVHVGMAVSSLVLAGVAAALVHASVGGVPGHLQREEGYPIIFALSMATLIVAVMGGTAWILGRPRFGYGAGILSAAGVIGTVLLVAPHVFDYRTTRDFVAAAQEYLPEGVPLIAYRNYPQSLPVYLDRCMTVAGYQGELAPGIARLSAAERVRRFPTPAEFGAIWETGSPAYAVVDDTALRSMRNDGYDPGSILVRSDRFMLLTNSTEIASERVIPPDEWRSSGRLDARRPSGGS